MKLLVATQQMPEAEFYTMVFFEESKCLFLDCTSKTDAGGLKVINGNLEMKCTFFELCHGEHGDNSVSGTAFGASMTNTNCSDIVLYQCWNKTSPFKDNIYEFDGGKANITRINVSHCRSQSGCLCGHFCSISLIRA